MTLLLDSREGSWQLATYEPLRSLLPACTICGGPGRVTRVGQLTDECAKCHGTGRQLSHITTSRGEGGPDALICGNGPNGPLLVAVEVKSLRDLISSADTGRLQANGDGQLQSMLADYDQCWLLWHGSVRCGDDGYLQEPRGRGTNGRTLWGPYTKNADPVGAPLRCEFLEAMLLAIAAMGVHVHRAYNIKDTARWLGSLYRYWSKPWGEHTFTRTFKDVTRFPKVIPGVTPEQLARAKRIADRYPGLGTERALAAAKHFANVRAMANASEKEWQAVVGIGKVIAGAVVKAFND